MRRGSGVLAVAVAVFAVLLGGGKAFAATSVKVKISGLPPGVAGKVIARGPHLRRTLRRSTTLRHVRAGRYTFTVRRVRLAHGRRKVRSGSLALPSTRVRRVRVKAGHGATVRLRYGTIVNANVRKPSLRGLRLTGDPVSPSTITLPATRRIKRGMILTGKPSATLPAGLFHRVTKVRRRGRRLVITLRPAHLAEAFPQLDLDSHLKFDRHDLAAGKAGAAAFDPLVASLGMKWWRCSDSLADTYIRANESLGLDATVQVHIPTFWGIPTGLPDGKLALTLHGNASLDSIFARKNSGCSANFQLPPLPGEIPVGPVVVPVYAQVGISGSASVAADFKQHAAAGFSLTAGMTFHGTSVHNISTASAYADASASGAGKIAVGPTIRFAVGAAKLADVHFDAKPQLAFTATIDPSCSLDLVGGSQVGISVGPFQINQPLPAPSVNLWRCPAAPAPQPTSTPNPLPSGRPHLQVEQTGPLGAFLNQAFGYAIRVTNDGDATAHGVRVAETLPGDGAFIDSEPAGTPAAPGPGDRYAIAVGDLAAGESRTLNVHWRAPGHTASLTARAVASGSDAADSAPSEATVPVGTTANCNPCGADAAGTGLRNRDHGAITIAGVPAGATVGRAVLIWGVLYDGDVPKDTIAFDGHPVTADVAANVSGNLCWGDSDTIGYAADVTPYVTGNGTYDITDPPHGEVRVDDDPSGTLPYTDGASLVVFYTGGGVFNQVLSDFAYDTNTDDNAIHRAFDGINSVGGAASLILAGPDGQDNAGESFTFTGSDAMTVDDAFDGSDHEDGPDLTIGNLWDTDRYDVSSIVPAGQTTFAFDHTLAPGGDCIGVGAAVLQVSQRTH